MVLEQNNSPNNEKIFFEKHFAAFGRTYSYRFVFIFLSKRVWLPLQNAGTRRSQAINFLFFTVQFFNI
jgi:hypothetical protein